MRLLMIVTVACLAVMACEMRLHPHTDYLNQSVGRESHDAIAMKLGAPHRVVPLDKGGDLWTYDYCPPGRSSVPPAQCQRLNLVFDKSGKLVEWHDEQ